MDSARFREHPGMSLADEAVHVMENAGRMNFPRPNFAIHDDLAKTGQEMGNAGERGG
jgi:hypothetical protein